MVAYVSPWLPLVARTFSTYYRQIQYFKSALSDTVPKLAFAHNFGGAY